MEILRTAGWLPRVESGALCVQDDEQGMKNAEGRFISSFGVPCSGFIIQGDGWAFG